MITFDHIAVAANTLGEGAAYFKSATGIDMSAGGEHPDMGTHNRLVALGPDTFAEIIAINPNAPAPNRRRWFDLDNPEAQAQFPRLHAWLLRTDDIERCIQIAADLGIDLGQAMPLKRGDLRWRFTVRGDGTIPLGGIAPLILQWDSPGAHPAHTMADLGLRMKKLRIETPNTDCLIKLLNALGLKNFPEIASASVPKISAILTDESGGDLHVI